MAGDPRPRVVAGRKGSFPGPRTNILTGEAVDEFTGCPEYKVCAVRLEPVGAGVEEGERGRKREGEVVGDGGSMLAEETAFGGDYHLGRQLESRIRCPEYKRVRCAHDGSSDEVPWVERPGHRIRSGSSSASRLRPSSSVEASTISPNRWDS